jgi:DNA-binding PadR family transcriptional regulator
MPGGRGRGRGGGRRRMLFLQSCYSLMDGLSEFGFQPDQMDISIIYRALRDMQANNLVSDSWDDNSLGPQRRVYTITSQGEEALAEWIENLRQRRKEIETLEAAYDAVKKNG